MGYPWAWDGNGLNFCVIIFSCSWSCISISVCIWRWTPIFSFLSLFFLLLISPFPPLLLTKLKLPPNLSNPFPCHSPHLTVLITLNLFNFPFKLINPTITHFDGIPLHNQSILIHDASSSTGFVTSTELYFVRGLDFEMFDDTGYFYSNAEGVVGGFFSKGGDWSWWRN